MNGACADIACEWALVTPPVMDPLTTDEAIAQARAPDNGELGVLLGYIKAATGAAEQHMSRGLLTQTWKFVCATFADLMWLPMAAPLQSVATVKYYDLDGVLQTLATTYYDVDTTSRPGRITRAANKQWPGLQADKQSGRVEITYVVGWASADLVPERIKQGLRLYVAYMHYDREGAAQTFGGRDLGQSARVAAEACWSDVVYWKPPAYA